MKGDSVSGSRPAVDTVRRGSVTAQKRAILKAKREQERREAAFPSTCVVVDIGNPAERGSLVTIRAHGKEKQVCRKSLYLFPVDDDWGLFRRCVISIVEWRWFDLFILLCIVFNSVLLALYEWRGDASSDINWFIDDIADHVLWGIFSVECSMKIISLGFLLDRKSYLRDPWNILDFVVVVSGVIERIPGTGDSGLSFLRTLRVLRPLRSLNAVPQMKVLVNTALGSMARLGNVTLLGLFLFTVFGIVGTTLMPGVFYRTCHETRHPVLMNGCWSWNTTAAATRLCGGGYLCEDVGGYCGGHEFDLLEDFRPSFGGGERQHPWCSGSEPKKLFPETDFVHFDHLPAAMLLIFQCMTLEGWTELMYMAQDAYGTYLSTGYFFGMVMLTNFFLLNIALAVVDESRDEFAAQEEAEREARELAEIEKENQQGMAAAKAVVIAPNMMLGDWENEEEEEQELWWDVSFVRQCTTIARNEVFMNFIMIVIALNVVIMCLERFPADVELQDPLFLINVALITIFVFEMCIMIVSLGPKGYVTNPVTCFDGIVVIISLVEMGMGGEGGLKALRTLRLFRVLNKLALFWTSFRALLRAIVQTGIALNYWLMLFFLVMYIFTLIFMEFFATKFHFQDPDDMAEVTPNQGTELWCPGTEGKEWYFRQDCIPRANFDTFIWGFTTIFQVMTGENWNTVMYAGMRSGRDDGWMYSIFFIILILVGQTLCLSLFLSMLISTFDVVQDQCEKEEMEKAAEQRAKKKDPTLRELLKKGATMAFDRAEKTVDRTSASFLHRPASVSSGRSGTPSDNGDAVVALHPSDEGRYIDSDREQLTGLDGIEIPPAPRWPHGYSLLLFHTDNPIRRGANWFLDKDVNIRGSRIKVFDNFILTCILISSLTMTIDRPLADPDHVGIQIIRSADKVFAGIFIFEMAVKLIAMGLAFGPDAYLKSGWNCLDGAVVTVSVLDFIVPNFPGFLKILRILRTFRPLRLISRNESLKVVIQTVFASVADLLSLIIVTGLFLLIFALVALTFLKGKFYSCDGNYAFARDLGVTFTTPLCLGTNILDHESVGLRGSWDMNKAWNAPVEDTCGRPWARASSDTPICLARCIPSIEAEVPAPEELCPRKYTKTEELPSMCPDAMSSGPEGKSADELVGERFVNAMQRTLVVPCGGVMIDGFTGGLSNAAYNVSCRHNFCPHLGTEVSDHCRYHCLNHPIFCHETCSKEGSGISSMNCLACRAECEAMCECKDFCEPLVKDAALCHEQGGSWRASLSQNFDSIENSILTLFEISTTEGWVDVMYAASDEMGTYVQPVRDSNLGWIIFFVVWIAFSFMFLINLGLGVMVDKFMDLKEQGGGAVMLTEAQRNWLNSRKSLHGRSVFFSLTNLHLLPPRRRKLYEFVTSPFLETFIMVCIILNTVIMMFQVFPDPAPWWDETTLVINYIFAFIFTVEAVLKLGALRWSYWPDNWNRFDFSCVVLTDVGIALKLCFDINAAQFTKVIRIFRVARLFRLLQWMRGINRLFTALLLSVPKLVNVSAVLILFLILFSILGVRLFSTVKHGETFNEHGDFRNFFYAFVTLARGSTGEAWNEIMHDLAKTEMDHFHDGGWCVPMDLFDYQRKWDVLKAKCMTDQPVTCVEYAFYPKLYWCVYTLLITFMIMNLVIAVVLEGYNEGKADSESRIIDKCIDVWKKHDADQTMNIPLPDAIKFINAVMAALKKDGSLEGDIPPLKMSAYSDTVDVSSFPMKFAKAVDLPMTDDKTISFIDASKQILRFAVLEKNLDAADELANCDDNLTSAEKERMSRLEKRNSVTNEEARMGNDLRLQMAAAKIQRRFRAKKAREAKERADKIAKEAAMGRIGPPPRKGSIDDEAARIDSKASSVRTLRDAGVADSPMAPEG